MPCEPPTHTPAQGAKVQGGEAVTWFLGLFGPSQLRRLGPKRPRNTNNNGALPRATLRLRRRLPWAIIDRAFSAQMPTARRLAAGRSKRPQGQHVSMTDRVPQFWLAPSLPGERLDAFTHIHLLATRIVILHSNDRYNRRGRAAGHTCSCIFQRATPRQHIRQAVQRPDVAPQP